MWPDTAAVVYRYGVGCTGVLVAPKVVLTAGHCIGGIQSVLLDIVDYEKDQGEEIEVQQTIEYPNSWSTYDVALLKLAQPAKTTPRVIARDCILDDHYGDGETVIMTGWGAKDSRGVRYDSLLRAGETLVEDHDCTDISEGCNRSVSPDGELRAGGTGADACYGDSGGPLYLPTAKGDYLIGLTSRGYTWSSVNCGEGTIYVRPDAIVDWIEDEAGITLPRPDCGGGGTDTGGTDDTGGPSGANRVPVPTAEAITVVQGATATTTVEPNDPDGGDSHVYAVLVAPAEGEAGAGAGGTISYDAPEDYEGDDSFEVVVTDDGDPPESGVVVIEVSVVGRDGEDGTGGCGCTGAPAAALGPWGLALLGLSGLRRRDEA